MLKETTKDTHDFEDMLTLREVKDILGVSYGVVLGHIRNGLLEAHKVTGEPISREEVHDGTYGIRVKPTALREYLRNTLIQ